MGLQQFDEYVAILFTGTVVNADGTAVQDMTAPLPQQTRFDQFYLANSDTVDHVAIVSIDDGFSDIGHLGAVTVPSGAGYSQPAVEVFSTLLPSAQTGIVLPSNAHLRWQPVVAVALTFEMSYLLMGGRV